MQSSRFAVALLALAAGHALAVDETPMAKLVTLLNKMNANILASGKEEQASYDKYACWCEETLAQKASDITKAKSKIEELSNNIVKNKGALGAGGAMIAKLKKDIGQNVESQKSATQMRDNENSAYQAEKNGAENSIGALEAAIKTVTGAGTGKKGFLETLQEAKLLSVVASVRPVLMTPTAKKSVKESDLEVVQHFVEKPEDFFKGYAVQSALQIEQNPFGDYAPQSTQIQGILKSLYDSFTGDLEKDNAEEAEKQKSFEELMSTKKKELATLSASLEDETKSEAEATQQVADDKAMRDDTQEQLAADEAFFTSSKESCATKAKQWAQRSSLRSREVAGIAQAVDILSSDKAKKTFESATKFLQLSAEPHLAPGAQAYKKLTSLATRYQSISLAKIAIKAKTSGHFDDMIVMIDEMVAVLRKEEQEDIAHRDRCEDKQNANKNELADAMSAISKAKAQISRLESNLEDKDAEIKDIEKSMKATQADMDELASQRQKENAEFKQALKDDTDSIALLQQAEAAFVKFYKEALLQVEPTTVALVAGKKPAPQGVHKDGAYKGHADEAKGVLAILDMLQEDLQKEIKVAGQDEAEAQVAYDNAHGDLQTSYEAAEKAKSSAVMAAAELKSKIHDTEEEKDAADSDKSNEQKLAASIATDCNWVKTVFEKRRKSRKEEVAGLEEAKEFLAGVGTADDLTLPE